MKITFSNRLATEELVYQNDHYIEDNDYDFWENDPEWVEVNNAVKEKIILLCEAFDHGTVYGAIEDVADSSDVRWLPYEINTVLDEKFPNKD